MSRLPITTASTTNRRRARRSPVSGHTKVECRKGLLGLGPNLSVKVLDLSETGASLVVKTALHPGDEAELLLSGPSFARPVRCPARVVWSVTLAAGGHALGVNFERPLDAAQRHRLAKA